MNADEIIWHINASDVILSKISHLSDIRNADYVDFDFENTIGRLSKLKLNDRDQQYINIRLKWLNDNSNYIESRNGLLSNVIKKMNKYSICRVCHLYPYANCNCDEKIYNYTFSIVRSSILNLLVKMFCV